MLELNAEWTSCALRDRPAIQAPSRMSTSVLRLRSSLEVADSWTATTRPLTTTSTALMRGCADRARTWAPRGPPVEGGAVEAGRETLHLDRIDSTGDDVGRDLRVGQREVGGHDQSALGMTAVRPVGEKLRQR